MTDLRESVEDAPDGEVAVDGRVARRQRNIDAVLDVVLEMFAEDAMFPTIEQAAKRSGLSLRSLYRYFADPGELLEAAIARNTQNATELAHLSSIGEGPLHQRIRAFAAMRRRLYEGVAPVFRATIANAARHPRVRDERARNRNLFHDQFSLQFAPELAAGGDSMRYRSEAADLLCQLDSIDFLHVHRGLSLDEIEALLVETLESLLG